MTQTTSPPLHSLLILHIFHALFFPQCSNSLFSFSKKNSDIFLLLQRQNHHAISSNFITAVCNLSWHQALELNQTCFGSKAAEGQYRLSCSGLEWHLNLFPPNPADNVNIFNFYDSLTLREKKRERGTESPHQEATVVLKPLKLLAAYSSPWGKSDFVTLHALKLLRIMSSLIKKDSYLVKAISTSHHPLTKTITQMKSSFCQLDTIPTPLLQEIFQTLGPTILSIMNNPIVSQFLPSSFKHALVQPLLKKPSLDPHCNDTGCSHMQGAPAGAATPWILHVKYRAGASKRDILKWCNLS